MTEQKHKDKFDFLDEKWKKEQKCFEDDKVEGKDSQTGKKVSGHWPRDIPQAELQYREWLKKVQDPETAEFYKQRDKDGNIIKGTGPKHIVRQIVRIRTSDDKQFLYSNGFLLAYDVMGDPVSQSCPNPETWTKVGHTT